ncbi:MAG: hypothetical protein ACPGLY_21645 [Rubripirellula sp.]
MHRNCDAARTAAGVGETGFTADGLAAQGLEIEWTGAGRTNAPDFIREFEEDLSDVE